MLRSRLKCLEDNQYEFYSAPASSWLHVGNRLVLVIVGTIPTFLHCVKYSSFHKSNNCGSFKVECTNIGMTWKHREENGTIWGKITGDFMTPPPHPPISVGRIYDPPPRYICDPPIENDHPLTVGSEKLQLNINLGICK